VTEALVEELARQGVAEIMADEGSIPSRWPGQSPRRQTATWFLLIGLPPDSVGTDLDRLGPQLDLLDGRQGAEAGSVASTIRNPSFRQ
jgi:hypothetical protein